MKEFEFETKSEFLEVIKICLGFRYFNYDLIDSVLCCMLVDSKDGMWIPYNFYFAEMLDISFKENDLIKLEGIIYKVTFFQNNFGPRCLKLEPI